MVENRKINPWTWQNQFGFSQAIETTGHTRVLRCAGQTSVNAEGEPIHDGDMAAQIAQALDNLETVLQAADMALANVVRLNLYVTDIDAALENWLYVTERGNRPLIGVARTVSQSTPQWSSRRSR